MHRQPARQLRCTCTWGKPTPCPHPPKRKQPLRRSCRSSLRSNCPSFRASSRAAENTGDIRDMLAEQWAERSQCRHGARWMLRGRFGPRTAPRGHDLPACWVCLDLRQPQHMERSEARKGGVGMRPFLIGLPPHPLDAGMWSCRHRVPPFAAAREDSRPREECPGSPRQEQESASPPRNPMAVLNLIFGSFATPAVHGPALPDAVRHLEAPPPPAPGQTGRLHMRSFEGTRWRVSIPQKLPRGSQNSHLALVSSHGRDAPGSNSSPPPPEISVERSEVLPE